MVGPETSHMLNDLTEDQYATIEGILLDSPQGRAYLCMRDARARNGALADLDTSIGDMGRRIDSNVTGIKELAAQFAALRGQHAREDVAGRLNDILSSVRDIRTHMRDLEKPAKTEDSAHIGVLRQELQEMAATIQQTRREISAIRPDDNSNNRIMLATEELDAIVQATERATSDILNAAEHIMNAAGGLSAGEPTPAGVSEQLMDEVTTIFTACSFQDITGQRISKVVNTLRYLEKRVNAMINIWGVDGEGPKAPPPPVDEDLADRRPDSHLLNGPALNGGVNQDDIDALLNGSAPATSSSPVGQDDIDALMNGTAEPAPSEPVGQNDIDVLLNGTTKGPHVAEPKDPPDQGAVMSPMDQSGIDALFD